MNIKIWAAGYAAMFCLIVLWVLTAPGPVAAGGVTERERQDCRADYQRYCKIHPVGSEELRKCMTKSVRKLSNACVAALVDAGEMTRAQANARRKSGAKHTSSTRKPSHHKKAH